jgi:L-2-hydroxyglutarate oxidase LhgO
MRELGPAGAAEEENPLAAVVREMRAVQRRIARSDSGRATQTIQQQILAELDRLIRQARTVDAQPQTAGERGPGTSPPPQSRETRSGTPRGGPAGKSPPATGVAKLRGMMESVWGELPGRERERMLQTPIEEFLPEYESMLEDYFRHLAAPQEKRP